MIDGYLVNKHLLLDTCIYPIIKIQLIKTHLANIVILIQRRPTPIFRDFPVNIAPLQFPHLPLTHLIPASTLRLHLSIFMLNERLRLFLLLQCPEPFELPLLFKLYPLRLSFLLQSQRLSLLFLKTPNPLHLPMLQLGQLNLLLPDPTVLDLFQAGKML